MSTLAEAGAAGFRLVAQSEGRFAAEGALTFATARRAPVMAASSRP